jgi:hypothetical protein
MATKRRGMLIKNTNNKPIDITMANRLIHLNPGDEQLVTAKEVRDPVLRESLQVRAVSIVRPATEEEEAELIRKLEEEGNSIQ